MIFYCSLDELVVFKTRERGSIQELSKDPYTSEIKLIVPTPPERPHCLPLLASGLFVMSRSVDTEVPGTVLGVSRKMRKGVSSLDFT